MCIESAHFAEEINDITNKLNAIQYENGTAIQNVC